MFPNNFVNSSQERLNLYTQLNKIINEKELEVFKSELVDRFGALPRIVIELLKSLELRWLALDLGFEKIVLKRNILLGYLKDFDNDEHGKNLDKLFKYSKTNNSISFSQKKSADGDRFIIKVVNVDSISKAIEILTNISLKK
tara:strand:- start:944 stop:1369 length:426 start_codon:yes stop_codon:yes gene_type:complete